MIKKMVFGIVLVMVLSISLFSSRAAATSSIIWYTEANCSSMTLVLAGQTHTSKLGCGNPIGFSGVPAGTYSWTVTGCGLTASGTKTVNGTSTYGILLCPDTGGSCCPTGAGTGGAFLCEGCQNGSTTSTTSSSSTTTTTASSSTTTTSVAASDEALVVKNAGGTITFKVEDDGSVAASGNVAIGATSSNVPLLVQTSDTGHLATFFRKSDGDAEIQIGQSTAVNKAAVIGFNLAGAYYYMSVYGLGSNRLVFNSSGYLGVGTSSPEYLIDTKGGAYCNGSSWYDASSREYKKDIKRLSTQKAIDALNQLDPVEFAYKTDSEDRHVGFISEDAPDLVASKDRKGMSPMDVVAVLTKVVKEQQKLLRDQRKIAQEQQKAIGELSEKVAELESRLKSKEDPLAEQNRLKPSND